MLVVGLVDLLKIGIGGFCGKLVAIGAVPRCNIRLRGNEDHHRPDTLGKIEIKATVSVAARNIYMRSVKQTVLAAAKRYGAEDLVGGKSLPLVGKHLPRAHRSCHIHAARADISRLKVLVFFFENAVGVA